MSYAHTVWHPMGLGNDWSVLGVQHVKQIAADTGCARRSSSPFLFCTALLCAEGDVRFPLPRQCKQTCPRRLGICCMLAPLGQTQTMQHGCIMWPCNYVILPFPPPTSGWAGTPRTPGSCARTTGEFLSKQEARTGPRDRDSTRRPLALSTKPSRSGRFFPRKKTPDCCITRWQNVRLALPASLCRTSAAAVG